MRHALSPDGGLATLARVLASLLVVVVLAVVAARLARRAGVRGEGVGLRVVDRVGLTRDTAIAVVEVAGRRLVVGTSAHGVSVLAELDPADLGTAGQDRVDPTPTSTRAEAPAPSSASTPAPSSAPASNRVTVTRVVAPGSAVAARSRPASPVSRVSPVRADVVVRRPAGNGSVLDPRTWRQGLDAVRELTVRRG